jgi:hypothetical protein
MAPLCARYEELSAKAVAKDDWHRADLGALATKMDAFIDPCIFSEPL